MCGGVGARAARGAAGGATLPACAAAVLAGVAPALATSVAGDLPDWMAEQVCAGHP